MNFRKMIYSKCPNCKEHGLSGWKMAGTVSNPTLTCKHCGKKYEFNAGLSLIFTVAAFAGMFFLYSKVEPLFSDMPEILSSLLRFLSFAIMMTVIYLINYFAPLEEKE